MSETETIDRLFLELSQFTTATTGKELALARDNERLRAREQQLLDDYNKVRAELATQLDEREVEQRELRDARKALAYISILIGTARLSECAPYVREQAAIANEEVNRLYAESRKGNDDRG